MRQVQITVPSDRKEQVGKFLTEECGVTSMQVSEGPNNVTFSFYTTEGHSGIVMGKLESIGCGTVYGIIGLLHVHAVKPLPKMHARKRKGAHEESELQPSRHVVDILSPEDNEHLVKEVGRLAVEEIYFDVLSGAQITFDYIAYIVIGGIIAAIGLATNSPVMVVASMLVSPLMGPILAFTFGTVIRDYNMVYIGLRNELIGIAVTFATGIAVGFVFAPFGEDLTWPTDEMEGRGKWVSLLIGLGFAIPSGAGVALAVTSGGVNSLVGVAIAAALLPPIVNSGLCLVYAMIGASIHGDADVDGAKFARMALVSFLLYVMNVVVIWAMGVLFFRLKAIAPPHFKSVMWHELPKVFSDDETEHPVSAGWQALKNRKGHLAAALTGGDAHRSNLRESKGHLAAVMASGSLHREERALMRDKLHNHPMTKLGTHSATASLLAHAADNNDSSSFSLPLSLVVDDQKDSSE